MFERRRRTGAGVLAIAGVIAGTVASGQQQLDRTDRSSGAYAYKMFCAACHGEDGKGKGPAADTLRHPVPDLTVLAREAGGAFPRERVVTAIETGGPTAAHEPGGMPTWSEAFTGLQPSKGAAQKRIQAIVDYVETLQAKE